ncbi:MAG TPA: DUF2332 domain-containing protein [Rhizomicrobium sp.]|nr:DUF2332 domain-containing protein [Rhizomicrobium sp.]
MVEQKSFDYWEYFVAETKRANAPLYTQIVRGITGNTGLKELAARVQKGQPPANILLASVHYLLLRGAEHPLRQFYPNLNGGARIEGEDAFPPFKDFVDTHLSELLPLIENGITNTNEIARCSALHAGFRAVARETGEPLHLIEIGPSAGLNLLWDNYRVRYRRGETVLVVGPENALLTIDCELRGDKNPPTGPSPRIASRVGLERNPVDLSNPKQRDWLKALVWPDHLARFERLENAIERFRANPAEIRAGDALTLLPETIAQAPEDQPVCVYHTYVVYQFSEEMREALDNILIMASLRRPVWRLSCEGSLTSVGEAPMRLRCYVDGQKESRMLAAYQSHGSWLEWRD